MQRLRLKADGRIVELRDGREFPLAPGLALATPSHPVPGLAMPAASVASENAPLPAVRTKTTSPGSALALEKLSQSAAWAIPVVRAATASAASPRASSRRTAAFWLSSGRAARVPPDPNPFKPGPERPERSPLHLPVPASPKPRT